MTLCGPAKLCRNLHGLDISLFYSCLIITRPATFACQSRGTPKSGSCPNSRASGVAGHSFACETESWWVNLSHHISTAGVHPRHRSGTECLDADEGPAQRVHPHAQGEGASEPLRASFGALQSQLCYLGLTHFQRAWTFTFGTMLGAK